MHNPDIVAIVSEVLHSLTGVINESSPPFSYRNNEYALQLLNDAPVPLRNAADIMINILGSSHLNIRSSFSTAHMVQSPSDASLVGDIITSYLNQCSFIWEEAPASMELEQSVLSWFLEILSLQYTHQGLITSGGTISNLIALHLAKEKYPHRSLGKVRILCTEDRHLSIERAARIIGLSASNIHCIPSGLSQDQSWCWRKFCDEIEDSGGVPVSVISTYGQTGSGQIEDLELHKNIAERLGAWLHVDAAWGAGRFLKSMDFPYANILASADSISWDPHKTMSVSYPAGVLLVKKSQNISSLSVPSTYALSEASRAQDTGHFHLEGSRPLTAIKLWLNIKVMGLEGFRSHAKQLHDIALFIYDEVVKSDGYVPYQLPHTNIVCFRPKSCRYFGDVSLFDIRQKLFATGRPYFSTAEIEGQEYFRMVITNPHTSVEQFQSMLAELESFSSA